MGKKKKSKKAKSEKNAITSHESRKNSADSTDSTDSTKSWNPSVDFVKSRNLNENSANARNPSVDSTILRNPKKGKTGLKRIFSALFYSIDGLKAAWSDEAAFRQVSIMACIFTIIALFVGESWVEIMLLIAPCALCIITELLNSALENVVDLASLEFHPLAKKAKDMGSAAQFATLCFLAIVWISYAIGVIGGIWA